MAGGRVTSLSLFVSLLKSFLFCAYLLCARVILDMVPLGGITSYIDTRRTRGMVIDRFGDLLLFLRERA